MQEKIQLGACKLQMKVTCFAVGSASASRVCHAPQSIILLL